MLSLRNISKTFSSGGAPVQALDNLSLRIGKGEMVGLAGPSGCGKSTLLNIMGLCEAPTSGEMELAGKPVNFGDAKELTRLRRARLGYVFQYFNLLPNLTAEENVCVTSMLNGTPFSSAKKKSRELLSNVGLEGLWNRLPHQLSGGQMQRVALCRALAHAPDIVLADEPTGNLDSIAGAQISELLRSLGSSGTAVVMASHSQSALALCDRVLPMKDGRLLA